ncbi:MAG TPA: glycoside hydrolase family 3 N-terminal domain-containing protein [Candidatus Acidoferrales bacterium]|nr:glycoside hydrolase family 3 N-terminal domain-containing protein [Candidatus Acidoferrales bacterium]
MKPSTRPCLLLVLALSLLTLPVRLPAEDAKPEPPQPASERKLPRSAERWLKRTLERMTLEEKLGQLLVVSYFADFRNTSSEEYLRLIRQVRDLHVGGLLVATQPTKPTGFERSEPYDLAHLTNRLQQASRTPLLIAADFERGAAFRVRETTGFPHNMTLGATGNPDYAYRMGRIAAQEARALGVHWLLAPVADVNNNPANPIINIRSFGEDPVEVARYTEAFIRGCEESGALCTAKHFPGLGDSALDPHIELTAVAADRARFDSVELVPFRAAISAGVSAVMTEHMAAPALEPQAGLPATFSGAITTTLLRDQLGYHGLVITDDMNMSAITALDWPGEAAVRAFEAGADVLLTTSATPEVQLDALRRAAESGRLSTERINRSVERVLRAKAALGLHRQAQVDTEQLTAVLAQPSSLAAAQEMADRGAVLLRDDSNLLPLDSTRPQRGFLLVVSADADSYPGKVLEEELRSRVDSLLVARADRYYAKPETVALPSPSLYDWCVAAVFVRVADRKGNVALPANLATLVEKVLAGGKPTALVVLGSPYLPERFPQAGTVLLTLSTAEISEHAAIRALFGQTAISGRLPVAIPDVAPRGAGLARPAAPMELAAATPEDAQRFQPVFSLLDKAVADHVFPGGVLAVGHQGRLVALHPFGRLTYDADSPAVTADTLYDLASLTKVVGATTAVMMLTERNRLLLDAPVVRYVPEFGRGPDADTKKLITVRQLLTHSSGLAARAALFETVYGRRQVIDRTLALGLETAPGVRSRYSDMGIITLGEVLERVSGRRLDDFLRDSLFQPLGMSHTLYNPPRGWRERIAPTEENNEGRRGVIQGEVHDGNAWAMEGVAPHAGLFSTAGDLAVFCQMLLNGGSYAHQRLLRRSTIEAFATKQDIPDSSRALGWDTVSQPSSSGRYFSARAFGHTGFTGTSIWIDPEKELFVILLTNRAYPTHTNNKHLGLRPALHDAVVEVLGLVPAPAPSGPAPQK